MDIVDKLLISVCIVWIISELVLNSRQRSNDLSKDRSSLLVLMITNYGSAFLGAFIAVKKIYGNMLWGNQYLHLFGLILIVSGIVIRRTAIFTLKRQFTVNVAIVENHRVIDTGIYHYVRHPAYLGGMVSFLGLALYFGNWISFILIFFPSCFAHLHRMAIEEKVLLDHFGAEYADYCRKTKRLIPGVY